MHANNQADGHAAADQPIHQPAAHATLLRDPEEEVTASSVGVQGKLQ